MEGRAREVSRANKGLDLLEAILGLTLNLTSANLDFIKRTRQVLVSLTRKELRQKIKQVDYKVRQAKNYYGVKYSDKEVVNEYKRIIKTTEPGKTVHVPRTVYEEIFSRFGKIATGFQLAPVHSSLELAGPPHDGYKEYLGFFTPETSLYESMAAQYNLYVSMEKSSDKSKIKTRVSCARSCIFLSLGFVEAFLSGLAQCVLISETVKDEKDLSLLLERDPRDASRKKFVSFRQKLLQYPRIATGSDVPILTESNCEPLKFILEVGKELRDSFAHPSGLPELDLSSGIAQFKPSTKYGCLVGLGDEKVGKVVDAATKLVLEIDQNCFNWIGHFVVERAEDSKYPEFIFA